MTERVCPLHDRELEQVADNKFRCPEGHDVHESAVGRGELFEELRDRDDPVLAAIGDVALNYDGGDLR